MQEYFITLLGGLVTTLELTLLSLLLGIALALLMTWVLELRIPVATQLVQLWVLIFTGTPLLIQIFLIYYGPGQFEWLKSGPLWPLRLAPKLGMKRLRSPSQPQLELTASALRCTDPRKPPT